MTELDLSAMLWRKSTRSSAQGGDCVEVAAARWRKSNRSSGQGGNCVEVAGLPGVVAVRDSKNPGGPKLAFTAAEWTAFTRVIKTNNLDLG